MLSIQGLKLQLDGPNGGVDVSKVAQKEFVLKVLVKPPKLVYETWPFSFKFRHSAAGFAKCIGGVAFLIFTHLLIMVDSYQTTLELSRKFAR